RSHGCQPELDLLPLIFRNGKSLGGPWHDLVCSHSILLSSYLLDTTLAAARGARDDNDSLAGLIVTFFSGICLEQNLGPDRARITKKIDAFMRLIRAI
ncbi:MAG TPA: hypothetical protein VKH40_17220, partial [Alloacidobacterium sp.]|nr:hypothetical protein [Alloacidobacterium sp.]